ncbi:hypothetical protein ACFWP5_08900 [Streptomyces sp. NPDC058469]|uniref:hypothetical protein n=1 Tax=Streptomyces sp. NPDC058469 TaxID=3346514 RepID=UPI0036484810
MRMFNCRDCDGTGIQPTESFEDQLYTELHDVSALVGDTSREGREWLARVQSLIQATTDQRVAEARIDELTGMEMASVRILHKDGFRSCIDVDVVSRRKAKLAASLTKKEGDKS